MGTHLGNMLQSILSDGYALHVRGIAADDLFNIF